MSMLSERDEGNYTCSAKDDRGVVTNFTHFLRIMCKVYLKISYLNNKKTTKKINSA